MQATPSFLAGAGGERIAYFRTPPAARPARAGIIFFPGLLSHMGGTKALALESFIIQRLPSCSYTRFDYTGHGQSSGTFTGTHPGDWLRDALAAVDRLTDEGAPLVVVGSSMGGLLAIHAALLRPARVAALVLVAPAAGLAERRWEAMGGEQRVALLAGGAVSVGSGFADPPGSDEVTLAFFEKARELALPEGPSSVAVRCPVRILHGGRDDVVPVAVSERLVGQLAGEDVALTVVKDGDHRLSSKRDLGLLTSAVGLLAEAVCAGGRG